MAATAEPTQQSLKCNTWVLKVPIHCVGCKRQVKKLLHTIDGVYAISIDSQQQKVTVTGNIDSEILLKKLLKTGKHAEIWAEKSVQNPKKNSKQTNPKDCQIKEGNATQKAVSSKETSSGKPDSKTPAKHTKGVNGGEKTKKGKGQKGNCANRALQSTGLLNGDQGRCQGVNPVHLSRPIAPLLNQRQHPTVQALNYKTGHGLCYQVLSSSPSVCYNIKEQAESYKVKEATAAFNTFHIFSDENPNACSIM